MLLKLAGAAVVIGATALTGFYYGSFETYRSNDLREIKKALAILRAEIEFSLNPLPQALTNIGERVRKPVSEIFLALAGKLKTQRHRNIDELWEESLLANTRHTYLNKEDISALISFGRTLGYLDTDMQTAGIAVMTGYIDSAVSALNETRARNRKLFASLGVLGGMLVVVVLI